MTLCETKNRNYTAGQVSFRAAFLHQDHRCLFPEESLLGDTYIPSTLFSCRSSSKALRLPWALLSWTGRLSFHLRVEGFPFLNPPTIFGLDLFLILLNFTHPRNTSRTARAASTSLTASRVLPGPLVTDVPKFASSRPGRGSPTRFCRRSGLTLQR